MELQEIDFSRPPYEMAQAEKDIYFTGQLKALTDYHGRRCLPYRRMLDALGYRPEINHYSELPWLPTGLFKRMRLTSLGEQAEYKVGQSSGTTGRKNASVVLDGETRFLQQQALTAILGTELGFRRLPMMVVERGSILADSRIFSAKVSGIRGFSLFGKNRTFVLNEDGKLEAETVRRFLERFGGQQFLIYGFTSQVWQHLYLECRQMGWKPDLSRAVLIHGGGWKKLRDLAVSREAFREGLLEQCGIRRIHDYYGMAEQAGSIFLECEHGHLHCSDYSAVLFRRAEDFSICDPGEKGLIQVMSLLPRSYPGHNLLTEDEGRLLGTDDCPCGRKGVYFEVTGRLARAEIRGCSDTYEN